MAKSFWKRNTSKKAQKEIGRLAELAEWDVKAVNILVNAYWDIDDDGGAWMSGNKTPAEDFAYARDRGVMLDPISRTHDEIVEDVVALRSRLEREAVAKAFVASLSSRRFDTRSTLSCYAMALHLEPHDYVRSGKECAVCGLSGEGPRAVDANENRFLRLFLGGGVNREAIDYILTDLETFHAGRPPEPIPDDWRLLRAVLDAIRSLPKKAGLGDLQKSLSGVIASNKQERQVLLEVLGQCGILQPRERPGYLDRLITADERESDEPAQEGRMEWQWPVQHWSGADGVNDAAVAFWFPTLTE